MDKIEDQKLPEPYNACLKEVSSFKRNHTIIDYILSINQTYKQKNCQELCFDFFFIKENPCSCSNASLGNVWKDCFIKKEAKDKTGCTFLYRTEFYKNNWAEKCSQYCPLECNSVSYSVTMYNHENNDSI